MILVNKNVGETPLQLLDRIRLEQPELRNETLSYAGRLDPMAEGKMLILVGKENKNREEFLELDKEYIATFLIGVKTDSGDVLGLVEKTEEFEQDKMSDSIKNQVTNRVAKLVEIKEQKYPWFSGQTVNGIKLFDHYKAGNIDIERPTRTMEIKNAVLTNFESRLTEEIKKYIFDSINKISGNFRQKEILTKWQEFFDTRKKVLNEARGGETEVRNFFKNKMFVFEIKILVSSGTYIRALTENFDFPVTLLKLNRTKIINVAKNATQEISRLK